MVGGFQQVLGFGGKEFTGDFVVEFGTVFADHEQEGLEGEWVVGFETGFSEDFGSVEEIEQLVLGQLDFGFGESVEVEHFEQELGEDSAHGFDGSVGFELDVVLFEECKVVFGGLFDPADF